MNISENYRLIDKLKDIESTEKALIKALNQEMQKRYNKIGLLLRKKKAQIMPSVIAELDREILLLQYQQSVLRHTFFERQKLITEACEKACDIARKEAYEFAYGKESVA